MRKHLSKWHRRIGIFAASIAIYLSVTGLMLNHSHDIGLDNSRLSNTVILKLYGIKPPAGKHTGTPQHTVDKLGDTVFLDGRIIGQYSAELAGAVELDSLPVIALRDSLLLLTAEGEIVETLTVSSGLPGQIARIGKSGARLLIQSGQQIYASDSELLNWQAVTDLPQSTSWATLAAMSAESQSRLNKQLPAYGPSWERLLQDLHSGRFFKLPGTLLIDLTGIIILLLSISGIVSFSLRHKAKRRKKHLKKNRS